MQTIEKMKIKVQKVDCIDGKYINIELKAALGVILNVGLHLLPDIKDYFSVKCVNRMPFFQMYSAEIVFC